MKVFVVKHDKVFPNTICLFFLRVVLDAVHHKRPLRSFDYAVLSWLYIVFVVNDVKDPWIGLAVVQYLSLHVFTIVYLRSANCASAHVQPVRINAPLQI